MADDLQLVRLGKLDPRTPVIVGRCSLECVYTDEQWKEYVKV